MLVLLPPSEGKTPPVAGRPVDPAGLALPELAAARSEVLAALTVLCRDAPGEAARVLGLGPRQLADVARDAALATAPTAPAAEVYTGVLHTALGLTALDPPALQRAQASVLVASGLWGVVAPGDRIPAYRLPIGVTLPGVGPLAAFWRTHLRSPLARRARGGLVVDLRSSAYAAAWRPSRDQPVVTVRVLDERTRRVVSHSNKATKGALLRDLLVSGADPADAGELAGLLIASGRRVEREGRRLDVLVPPAGG